MKHFDGAILRAVISVLLGIVLILWPAAAVLYIIMLIGAGFLLPGVISIVTTSYETNRMTRFHACSRWQDWEACCWERGSS